MPGEINPRRFEPDRKIALIDRGLPVEGAFKEATYPSEQAYIVQASRREIRTTEGVTDETDAALDRTTFVARWKPLKIDTSWRIVEHPNRIESERERWEILSVNPVGRKGLLEITAARAK